MGTWQGGTWLEGGVHNLKVSTGDSMDVRMEKKQCVHLCNSISCLCVAKQMNLQGQEGVCGLDTRMHEKTDP